MTGRHLRARRCPNCGESLDTVGNVFFGVGLSTHEFVRVCSDCYWTEFVPGTTEPAPIQTEGGRWRKLLDRIFGAHHATGQES